IRLFALGLSSAILGNVFNQLAFDLTGNVPVVSQLLTVLILLVGHSINFFMAALGAFVHPLRLTFVEFYKNTGFSGGGKAYQPFREMEEAKY
nr:V-type ATPase 116kDa subunit family protein [Prolixibacteraceae bacterium]